MDFTNFGIGSMTEHGILSAVLLEELSILVSW